MLRKPLVSAAESDRRLRWAMPAPAVLILVALIAYPLAYLLALSLREYRLSLVKFDTVWAKWYARLLVDPRFWQSVGRTLAYTASAVVLQMLLGTLIAAMLNRKFRGVGLARVLFLLPYIATPTASVLIWRTMFNPSLGVLNWLLEVLRLPPSLWLADPRTALASVVLVEVWYGTPFVMLVVLGGLKNMPVEPFECAHIDGASAWQRFRHLSVPLIRPALTTAAVFRLIDTLKQFPFIWILTEGGPDVATETMYIYGYKLAFKYNDMGYGAAVLFSLLLLILATSLVTMRMRERSWV